MATTLQNLVSARPVPVASEGLKTWKERVVGYFWFLLSLLLFVALGPFSGPVAIIVLCKLGLEDSVHVEPESIAFRN